MAKKNNLVGKYVIMFDTICEGEQCFKDEKEQPYLYDSYNDAFTELFDDNISMLENRSKKELKEYNEGVTPAMIKEMSKVYDSKDVPAMEAFLQKHPNCNDADTSVKKAEDFIMGYKTIFTGKN